MKRILFLWIFILSTNAAFSQLYGVSSYTKIGENLGGFTEVLDFGDWLGYSVESIGDLNGDGFNDIVVAALRDDDGGENRGAIYVLFLNEEGAVLSQQKISNTQGGFDGILDDWDIFGSSVAFLGDLNGDGLIEIGVGAEYDGDGGTWHGAIWILSLNNDGTVATHVKISDTEGGFEAPLLDLDVFGTDIAALGDLNGDGNSDIAVSARRDEDGGSDRGAVYILFLNADMTVNSYQKISDSQGGFTGSLDHMDYFGGAVANIGDLDGDGIIDLAVGAYRDDDGGLDYGAIYILFMNTDGTVRDEQKISDFQGNFDADFNYLMLFGKSIDLANDINEDGKPEIVVGASGHSNFEGPVGGFYVINLNSDGTVDSHVRYSEAISGFDADLQLSGGFGFSVAYNPLLTQGDAFVVGAYKEDEAGFQKGSVWTIQLGAILSIEGVDTYDYVYLFPNPAKNSFAVSTIDRVNDVLIYDASGRLIMDFDSVSQNQFNVSYLPIGSYLVTLVMEDGDNLTYKLIKG